MEYFYQLLFLALCAGLISAQPQLQECDACLNEFCGNVTESPMCSLTFIRNETNTEEICGGSSTCFQEGTAVECFSMPQPSHRVLSLDVDPVMICAESKERLNNELNTVDIDPGLYIVNQYRFCHEGCIDRIFLRADEQDSSSMEFSLYKRYKTAESMNELFVRRFAFDTTLTYNISLRAFEAVPNIAVDVKMGEYIGLSVASDVRIIGTREGLPTHGSWTDINISNCLGASSVFDVNTGQIERVIPLISVQLLSCDSICPPETVPPESSPTMPTTTESTGDVTTPADIASSSNLSSIVGAIVAGIVIIAFLITVIVVTVLCLSFVRQHKSLSFYSSNQTFDGAVVHDNISMSTYSSQYQENRNYYPPNRNVVTVVNPVSSSLEDIHDYNEPSEMNAARALPHLPTTTVPNIHYGSQPNFAESNDPHYQDPEELASTPMIERKRNTLKNPLYSTTGEFFGDRNFDHNQALNVEVVPIYDQPTELATKDSHSTNPGTSTETGNIYRDYDTEENTDHPPVATNEIQYTEPVSANIGNSESFKFPTNPPDRVHVQTNEYCSEPLTEVVEATGRIYHLLDKHNDSFGSDGSRSDSLLRSNIHHIVNETGAYVPNAEGRKELFRDSSTLSVDRFER